uniref:Uncharacterized protein n=1 Tax=Burkholderia orbicola (strain AU 1054) TaxID=331271 RepID=A0A0H2XY12_BURO1
MVRRFIECLFLASSAARGTTLRVIVRIAYRSFAATTCDANGRRADRFNRRKPGGAARAPVRTCPCGSGSRAGKCRPGADDRQPAGSASHRARRDGLSRHAGPLQARCSNGDVPNHCDRGLRTAACDDRSFFYPVCCLMLVPATGRCRCSGDQPTTFRARRDAAAAPRPTAASPRTASWPVRKAFAA